VTWHLTSVFYCLKFQIPAIRDLPGRHWVVTSAESPAGTRVAQMVAGPRCAVGVPNVGAFGDPRLLVDMAVAAEEHGWDGFFLWDHLLYRDPAWHVADPLVVIAAGSLAETGAGLPRLRCYVPFMDLWRGRRRRAVSVAAVTVLLASGAAVGVALHGVAPLTERNLRIPVVDGPRGSQHVVLDATMFTPRGHGRVPAILLAHGFGETKAAVRPQAEYLARAGFAVLTWSARGFGASTGQIALDSPDYEVKDTEQLVSWLARQPRVLLDRPGDPRVGVAGSSYGGGISLLAAAYDHRIDAVVAGSTWNNLATALFPNAAGGAPAAGVFKREWAGLLFTQGSAGFGTAQPGSGGAASGAEQPTSQQIARAALCGRFLPAICAMYQQVATQGRATPQALSLLQRSSPASASGRMDAPTLLIQGEHDSLFGLDQADANYQAIHRNGAPVDMVWFAGGHDGGDQETSRLNALTAAWFHRWLAPASARPGQPGMAPAQAPASARPGQPGVAQAQAPATPGARQPAAAPTQEPAGAGTGQPGFAVTRVLGFDPSTAQASLGIAAAGTYPGLDGTRRTLVRLGGPPQVIVSPAGGAPASISVFPGLGPLAGGAGATAGGATFDMPGQSAAFTSAPLRTSLQVTGSPTVRVRVGGTRTVTVFAKVYDVDASGQATLPFQLVAPLRVTGALAGRVVTVRLPPIDYSFSAGHRLRLVLTSTDFGYAAATVPAVYRVALAGAGLTVPSDPALALVNAGLPWWVWAAPCAALLAAVLILAPGRRRHQDGFAPDLAEVPLEITGLTKRYRDGQLAVDDLSLRVERGQILGLLGPNGAGKTTTLRALMGLLHPNAGTITIFGRRVHAGSAALSRLGSFVEGPGFLPHLSGRANLELYWRATGRPAAGSHLGEVLDIAGLGAAVDRRVRTYSRGMCQRLAIAQAMLGLPDLLVLDEPMNGLDPPQIREMREVLRRYAADGRSVILSSHLLGEVEQTCSHVVVMSQGRRIAAGPVGEVAGSGGALVVGTTEADRAVAVLRETPGIEKAEARAEGVLVHPDGVPASAVVAALVGAGIPVDRVGPGRRLEEAFLALVSGQEASDHPEGRP
jgi:ABC-2 type transport system ATP-binding protein